MESRPASLSQRLLWRACLALAHAPLAFYGFLAAIRNLLRPFAGRKSEELLFRNIAEIWGLPRQSSFARLFATQVRRQQVVGALETLRAILRPQCVRVEGLDKLRHLLQAAEQHGRGQLVVTAHLGSWELVGKLCAEACRQPFYVLAKPSRITCLTPVLARLRARMGTQVLWNDQKALSRQMLKALQGGAWLGFVMDQKPLGRQGPLVDFFGRPTPFVGGPATMAIREQRPVIAVFCVRLGPLHYRLYAEEVLAADHGIADAQVATQLMAHAIERMIRLYPEQWCWDYRRWLFADPPKL